METGKLAGETHYACREIVAERDTLREHAQATREAMSWLRTRLAERDEQIAALQARVAELEAGRVRGLRDIQQLQARVAVLRDRVKSAYFEGYEDMVSENKFFEEYGFHLRDGPDAEKAWLNSFTLGTLQTDDVLGR